MTVTSESVPSKIHPWTAEFVDRELEQSFRKHIHPARITYVKHLTWFTAAILLALIIPEFINFGQDPAFLWLVLSRVTLAAVLVTLSFTYAYADKHGDEALFSVQLLIPPAVILFDFIKGGQPVFIGSMTLIILVLYVFTLNRMVYSVFVGISAAFFAIVSLSLVHNTTGMTLIHMSLLLVAANGFGYAAWRQFNMISRREYVTYLNEHHGREQLRAEVERRIATEDGLRLALIDADRSSQQKTGALDDLSHELRTPLNAIIGFSDSIKKEVFGPLENERYKEYIGIIHDSGNHLLDLITDMLDHSKAESGTITLTETPVDVEQLVNSVLPMVGSLSREADVEVTATSLSNVPTIKVDEQKVRQILLNLLSNAIKFTPSGGKVELIVGVPEDQSVMLAIKDNGVGIAKEDLGKVFRPFEQTMPHGLRGESGTGLGLPLSMRLAELHGAYISVESKVGEGSVFALVLPRERNLSATTMAPETKAAS